MEPKFVFISDTHFNHANIIKYCERPFSSVYLMNELMRVNLEGMDEAGYHIVHCGDVFFGKRDRHHVSIGSTLNLNFKHPENHILIMGNHDNEEIDFYKKWFGEVVGTRETWKGHGKKLVLPNGISVWLSHEPQQNLRECDYNFYGHHHNNMTRFPEKFINDYPWLIDSDKHYNVGVELTAYTAILFEEVLKLPKFEITPTTITEEAFEWLK